MSDYLFSFGEDNFPKDSREYVTLDTDKGKLLAIALKTSGVPHIGTFTDKQMRFSYDADYKDTVDEIVKKASSDEFEEMLREIKTHKDDSSYLVLLPSVAHYLNVTEGTLRNRPNELQVQLCRMFTRLWYCDTPTIQRELTRAYTANRQTERDLEEAKEREVQQNNTPEKRETVYFADTQHRQNVLKGDEDHRDKADLADKEEVRTGLISREVIRRQAEMIRRRQAVKDKLTAEKTERERKFGQ